MRGLAAVTCILLPGLADAQAPPDSVLVRLRRAEAAIATLERQMADQSESAVQTRSGAKLTISGRVAVHAFLNERAVNNVDNPQFAFDPSIPGSLGGLGMSIRQTRLRIGLTGLPRTLGGEALADVDVDFYGGQVPSSGGRHFPLLRVRTARGFVRWQNAELMIGQESPLVGGIDPVSPAAIGTPLFATSGNLWLWLPQVRLTAMTSGPGRAGFQVAALAPTSGDAVGGFDTGNDIAEMSKRPYLQTRLFGRWGDEEHQSELGCGVHVGWLRNSPSTSEQTFAAVCDLVAVVAPAVELRGELFTGSGLRGLGGGAIGQNFGANLQPLRSTGGWAQVNIRPSEVFQLGAGVGIDDPSDAALARKRNETMAVHATVRPVGAFLAGLEVRRTDTDYSSGIGRNHHVTLSLGIEF